VIRPRRLDHPRTGHLSLKLLFTLLDEALFKRLIHCSALLLVFSVHSFPPLDCLLTQKTSRMPVRVLSSGNSPVSVRPDPSPQRCCRQSYSRPCFRPDWRDSNCATPTREKRCGSSASANLGTLETIFGLNRRVLSLPASLRHLLSNRCIFGIMGPW
jgi:hypothetical protein